VLWLLTHHHLQQAQQALHMIPQTEYPQTEYTFWFVAAATTDKLGRSKAT
jgi:hypothetical protein